MSPPPDPPVTGPTIRPAPGGSSAKVCPPGDKCPAYRGEYDDEYRRLNGLSMTVEIPDLLTELTRATEDHLGSLREYVWQAPGVNNGRLVTAMDAVWYRNIDTHISEGKQLVELDIDAYLKLEFEQAAAVRKYMLAPYEKREAARAKRAAIAQAAKGGDPFPDSVLSDLDTPEKTEFKKKVYNAHVAAAKAMGRKFNMGLDDADLAKIERGRLQKDAAPALASLLAKCREDLKAEQEAGDALAASATAILVGSAYRGAVEELKIWQDLFPQYYKETAEKRAAAPGGEHGDKALTSLVNHYLGGKAAPGFGNHTNGIAVDFNAVQGGTSLATLRSQNAQWIKSWLYLWLAGKDGKPGHAKDFGFTPIATEAWHWEYHP